MYPAVTGTKNMVVSPHYLASMAGARILERGGNAFDAAVAVSACLAVVYPHMTGLGGDSFWLMYSRHDNRVRAYNGSGRSGYRVTRDRFAGERAIPHRGVRSAITVPGMADSWEAVLREYGRLSLAEALEPAIGYALSGFPVSNDQSRNTALCFKLLSAMPYTSGIYTPGGKVPKKGSRWFQRQLGHSLMEIAKGGARVFYEGGLARRITDYLQQNGGLLIADDFADHRGNWVEPVTGTYRGYTICQVPPNSQGFTGIMALNILENFRLNEIPPDSFEYCHLLVEALKLSFRDRNQVLSDPDFVRIPLDRLLSKEYARTLSQSIDMKKAALITAEPAGSDTAYAAVVDEEGNAVSFIQSLYFEFGSAVVAGDTGILLQNRGSFFSLDPLHVNCLEPHKRTFHTLMPAMALKDGKPAILYGTQGGEGQPQTQTVLITRMIDYGMDPQTAIDKPRWVWGRTWGEETQELRVESRIPESVRRKLEEAGHKVRVLEEYDGVTGHAQVIRIDDHGFRIGGTDPRCDGLAAGW